MVLIVVAADPIVALAIPWKVTNVDAAYNTPETGFGDVTLMDGYALTVVT